MFVNSRRMPPAQHIRRYAIDRANAVHVLRWIVPLAVQKGHSEIDASDRLGLLHLRQQRLIKRRYIAIIQPKEVKLHPRALQRRRALGRIGPARRNLLQHDGGQGTSISTPSTLSLGTAEPSRSEEHTSELQSLMRISYAVFCLKKKKQ